MNTNILGTKSMIYTGDEYQRATRSKRRRYKTKCNEIKTTREEENEDGEVRGENEKADWVWYQRHKLKKIHKSKQTNNEQN